MKNPKQNLQEKINDLERIKKRCQKEKYLSVGMLANFAMRDFLEWHIKDLKKILDKI